MYGLENNAEESDATKRVIRKRNPDSKLGVEPKKTDQSLRDGYENINTEHDKCSIALGGEILGNEYQDMHDSIAPTTNNDDSHVPTSASGALGDDDITSKNIATEGSIQATVGKDSEPMVSEV